MLNVQDDRTAGRGYFKPNPANAAVSDVLRLAASLDAVDVDVMALLASLALRAPLASPALTGVPTAPTAALGTKSGQLATMQALADLRSDLVAGAPDALDTLKEIADKLASDDTALAGLLAAVNNRLRFDAAQGLSDAAKTTLLANLGGGVWSTGDTKTTLKAVADLGWVMCNEGTIGDAASGATARANDDCQPLFALLYGLAEAGLALFKADGTVTTRAAQGTAAAAWAAHCRINLPRVAGRSLSFAGAGSGLTTRVLGTFDGAEAVTVAVANMPAHNHGVSDPGHVHGVADPGHAHGVSDPTHAHSIADPAHNHYVNDPGHAHGIADPGHSHYTNPQGYQGNYAGGGYRARDTDGYTGAAGTGIGIYGAGTGVYLNASGTGIGIYGAYTGISIQARGTGIYLNAAATGITTQSNGGGSPLGVLNPRTYFNLMIKL